MRFVVPGPPSGKARPRLNRGHVYSPDPGNFQVRVAEFALTAGLRPIEGPVRLTVNVIRRMPRSWSKVKRGRMKGKFVDAKPDLINIVAAVGDGLTGVAYHDDKQVGVEHSYRHWGDEDSTTITVEAA